MLTEYSEGIRYLIMSLYVLAVCLNCVFFFLVYSYLLENRIFNRIVLYIISMLLTIPSSCIVSYLLFRLILYIINCLWTIV